MFLRRPLGSSWFYRRLLRRIHIARQLPIVFPALEHIVHERARGRVADGPHHIGGSAVGASPGSDGGVPGRILGEGEWRGIVTVGPVVEDAAEVPTSCVQVCVRRKEIGLHEGGGFGGGSPVEPDALADLHEAALALRTDFIRGEVARSPDDAFYQGRVEILALCDGDDEAVKLVVTAQGEPRAQFIAGVRITNDDVGRCKVGGEK